MLTKEQKNELIRTYGKDEKDSGSTEVQIALLTARITYLTEHFKKQPKDFHSRRGLLRLVGRRRNLLKYLKAQSPEVHQELTAKLGIRNK
jgi:small subunit ribosomal protein S15